MAEDLCLASASVNKARVLEPNGGHGRIIYAALKHGAAEVVTVENYPPNVEVLQKNFSWRHDVTIILGDFLDMRLEDLGGQLFDAVIANPPFAQGQDIDHIPACQSVRKKGRMYPHHYERRHTGEPHGQVRRLQEILGQS